MGAAQRRTSAAFLRGPGKPRAAVARRPRKPRAPKAECRARRGNGDLPRAAAQAPLCARHASPRPRHGPGGAGALSRVPHLRPRFVASSENSESKIEFCFYCTSTLRARPTLTRAMVRRIRESYSLTTTLEPGASESRIRATKPPADTDHRPRTLSGSGGRRDTGTPAGRNIAREATDLFKLVSPQSELTVTLVGL